VTPIHGGGVASRPVCAAADGGLALTDCGITNAVRCVPPANKPTGAGVNNCNPYLVHDIARLDGGAVVLALGRVAHTAVIKAEGARQKDYPFSHGGAHWLPSGRRLLDTYHCSRYNTQTGRLTEEMFMSVMEKARNMLN
jgi:uracil-DNA glycosylase family 4